MNKYGFILSTTAIVNSSGIYESIFCTSFESFFLFFWWYWQISSEEPLQKALFMKEPINIYFVVSFLYFYQRYPLFAWPVIPTCSQIFPVLFLTSFSRIVEGVYRSWLVIKSLYILFIESIYPLIGPLPPWPMWFSFSATLDASWSSILIRLTNRGFFLLHQHLFLFYMLYSIAPEKSFTTIDREIFYNNR
jgi:hypothetical protein